MSRRICLSVWLISSVTLAILDLRSVALLQNESTSHLCYNCAPSNSTVEDCSREAKLTLCPEDLPYCATVASTPNVTSSLACVEATTTATRQHCSLSYTAQKQSYEMTCVCSGDRCNAPFSQDLRQQLLKFAATRRPQNETLDLTESFLKESAFSNHTRSSLYKAITMKVQEVNPTTMRSTTVAEKTERTRLEVPPRAEALKQGASPSDDDDDEGEGSGAYEESRSQVRGSPPAAPSSYLPADSSATTLLLNILVTTPVLLHVVV